MNYHRHSIRLNGYDYSRAGAYFVTICTRQRELYFNQIHIREAALACWEAIPEHHDLAELDEWVVMPNHVHGIIVIMETRRGVQLNAPTKDRNSDNPYSVISPRRDTLSVIVRTYKAAVTTACRATGIHDFAWQRNYYEHVIRNERELNAIRRYIRNNPLQWELDRDNVQNIRRLPAPKTVEDYLADIPM